jgi:hypothetical protein
MQEILQIINVGKPLASERLATTTTDVKEEASGTWQPQQEYRIGIWGIWGIWRAYI